MNLLHLSATKRDLACAILDCLADAAPTEAGAPGRWVDLSELQLGAGYDPQYALGLLRLPAALGVLEINQRTCAARVSSVNGGYLLRVLSDLLDCEEPIVPDWEREGLSAAQGARPLEAVDLLAGLELRRLELLPDAAPVRRLDAAYGLLMQLRDGERHFLLCFDTVAQAWQLPGGRYEHRDRSLRATLLRELEEELGLGPLQEPRDLRLEPLGQRVAGTRLSPGRGLLTRTVFHFFLVEWAGQLPSYRNDARWVSERELRAGRTNNGQLVSAEPLVELLDHAKHEPVLRALEVGVAG